MYNMWPVQHAGALALDGTGGSHLAFAAGKRNLEYAFAMLHIQTPAMDVAWEVCALMAHLPRSLVYGYRIKHVQY